MAGAPAKKTADTWFEVLVSFNGLDKGDAFPQKADDLGWALQHAETGYLRVLPEEEVGRYVRGYPSQR